MRRGDLIIAALAGDYGKPTPYVVVQADVMIGLMDSLLACPLSTDRRDLSFRVIVEPTAATGLSQRSEVLVDKLTPVPTTKVGRHIGRVEPAQLLEIDAALRLVLGL